jgi:paraquat-inducible protein A
MSNLTEVATIRLPMRLIAAIFLLTSFIFFVLGLMYPIMTTEVLMGLKTQEVFLPSSVTYFFDAGDYFIGTLILLFSMVFPGLKYLLLLLKIVKIWQPKSNIIKAIFDLFNKWAMLDVFVVALVIINMKFDSILVATKLSSGTTYFAISVLLLVFCTLILSYLPQQEALDKIYHPIADEKTDVDKLL